MSYASPVLRRSFFALAVVACTVVACSSLPELTFGDDDAGGSEGGVGEGSAGEGSVVDAKPDTAPACVKTGVEICDDGIDNDCNGSFDCADPACTAGFVCTDAPPAGWQLVAFNAGARPACPANFGLPTDLSTIGGTGVGTCSCQCGVAVGSTACSAGQGSVAVSDQGVCSGGVTDTRAVDANAAACTPLSTLLNIPPGTVFAKASPPPPPTACTSSTTLSVPPLATGRLCAPPTRLGTGCAGGQVCAPRPTGMATCAAKAGPDTCPATYPKRTSSGTGGVDNRACNACTCSPQTCPAPSVTLYNQADCSILGAGKSVALAAACAAPAQKNLDMVAYKSTLVGSGCAPAGFNGTSAGSIAWVGEETVCCK